MNFLSRVVLLFILLSANIAFADNNNNYESDTLKNKAIYYFKKWTYWDYLYKPKFIDNFINNLKDKNINISKSENQNTQEESSQNIATDKIDDNLQLSQKNKIEFNLPKTQSNNSDEVISPPRLPDEFEEYIKKIPDADTSKNFDAGNELNNNSEESISIPKLPDEFDNINFTESSKNDNSTITDNFTTLTQVLEKEEDKNLIKEIDANIPKNDMNLITSSDIIIEDNNNNIKLSDISQKTTTNTSIAPPEKTEKNTLNDTKIEFNQLELADKEILLSEGYSESEADKKIKKQKNISPEQIKQNHIEEMEKKKFIENEMTMLVLPEDDVTTGKLTYSAKLTYSNNNEFLKLFWKALNDKKSKIASISTDSYISYVNKQTIKLTDIETKVLVNDAINTNNIDKLRIAIDNSDHQNLIVSENFDILAQAASTGRYDQTYLLFMKGLSSNDYLLSGNYLISGNYIYEISENLGLLLNQAGIKNRPRPIHVSSYN